MMTLGRMAWKYGGGAEGWRSATTHASKCIRLGSPFAQWEPSSETLTYAFVERSMTEKFSEAWTRHEEWTSTIGKNDDELGGMTVKRATVPAGGARIWGVSYSYHPPPFSSSFSSSSSSCPRSSNLFHQLTLRLHLPQSCPMLLLYVYVTPHR